MDSYTKEIKEQSEKEFNEKMEKLQNNFSSGMAEHEKAIGRLTATNYRTLGQFWDSEKIIVLHLFGGLEEPINLPKY